MQEGARTLAKAARADCGHDASRTKGRGRLFLEMESVAAELRALPAGGEVPENYLSIALARTEHARRFHCPVFSEAATR
jgi:hypothetical protein